LSKGADVSPYARDGQEAVKRTYTLIVTDTSPLITLALAGELDLLLRLGTPVSIPDAVFNEATRVRAAGGASAIVEWVNAHLDQVHIAPTEVGIDQQRRLEEGRSTRGLGARQKAPPGWGGAKLAWSCVPWRETRAGAYAARRFVGGGQQCFRDDSLNSAACHSRAADFGGHIFHPVASVLGRQYAVRSFRPIIILRILQPLILFVGSKNLAYPVFTHTPKM
jgi:hypothetical protein